LTFPNNFAGVDKATLRIYKETAGIPIVGGCSACKNVVFDGRFVEGAAGERRDKLENMFQEHYRGVHQSKDGSLPEAESGNIVRIPAASVNRTPF
jgi:hypothetical protein